MNKSELIDQIAQRSGLQKNEATKALEATISSITDGLRTGKSIAILGFGTFNVKQREARMGRNPKTGESMQIAASKAVSFKPGKGLKEAVNK